MKRLMGAAGVAAFVLLSAGTEAAVTIDAAKYIDKSLADCGIQKCIDEAAAAGGGEVKLPEGTFELRRGLVIRNGVSIIGAGMDKTILTPARRDTRVELAKDGPDPQGKLQLTEIPEGLEPGVGVVLWRGWPSDHVGYQRVGWVKEVDKATKTVRVEMPYGPPCTPMKPGQQFISFGLVVAQDKDIAKGDTEIQVKNAKMFKPGDELAIGEPQNDPSPDMVFVKEVKGNSLVLESPTRKEFKAWQGQGWGCINNVLWAVHPMIHGWSFKNAAVRDLTIKGRDYQKEKIAPAIDRYTLSGIHFYNAKDSVIERVAVRDWPADGISLQTGDKVTVKDCEATGGSGNGFHPGTGLMHALFEGCYATRNGAGLYFCWGNDGHILRKNRFVANRGGGVTGLGNPGDRNNIVEDNTISDNGGPGVEMNGDPKSNNTIRNNIIENNSRQAPGKWAGIVIDGNATQNTIEGNTIRDTQQTPTQLVGIEEKNGDENVIRGNKLSGHKTADIVVAGPKTVVEKNGDAKVTRREPKSAKPSQ